MKELIKIEKQLVGAEEVNTIDARDLHEELGVKKQFSEWINHQVNSLGLEKNLDYVVSEIKIVREVGASKQKNYILTLDTAKHIAMASRTAKGKEVRAYFIAIEKEFKAAQVPHTEIDMQEFMKTMQLFMINISEVLLKQSEAITALAKAVEELADPDKKMRQQRMERLQLIVIEQKKSDHEPICVKQRDTIRESVNARARELQDFHNMDTAKVSQIIFSELNKKFATKSYGHIKQKDYVEACLFVKTVELFNF